MEKAAASNGAAVGRLKTALGDAYQKGMSFNEIVDAIAKKFDGQFASALDTTNGKLENLNNRVDSVNEKIGKQMAGSLKSMLDAFEKLPEPMQNFAIATYQITGKAEPVASAFGNLAQVLGTLFPEAMATAGAAILEGLGVLVSWPVAIGVAIVAGGVLIYKNWDAIVAYLKGVTERIKQYMMVDQPAAFNSTVEAVAKWYYGVKYWIQDQFGALVDWLVKKIPEITAAFKAAAEAIVLHSIVPDMVNGIADNFGKLQSVMVAPAVAATGAVTKTFDELMSSAASVMNFINPSMFAGITMPSQGVKFANVFSSTSALTETAPGTQITLNMTGMLGTDDPQTRAQISSIVSDAVMQGMRSGRLLGTA
jgi:phage-related tail protein